MSDPRPDGCPIWLDAIWPAAQEAVGAASQADWRIACTISPGAKPAAWVRAWRDIGIKHTTMRAGLMLWWKSKQGDWPTAADVAGIPDEARHFMLCGKCGGSLDMRALDQVIAHEHDGPHEATGIIGERVN